MKTIKDYKKEIDELNRMVNQLRFTIEQKENKLAEYELMLEKSRSSKNWYLSRIEEGKKEIDNLNDAIKEKNKELDDWKRCNRNLLRIQKEKSNVKRGIYPKKEHSGYLLIYSNPVDYRYNFRGIHKKAQLYQTVFQTPYTIDVRYEDAYVGVKDDLTKEVYDDESLLDKLGGYYFWPDDIYEDIIKTNIKEAQNNYYDYLIEDFIDKNNREPYYSEKDEMKGLSSDYDTDHFFNMNLRINGKEGYWEVMIWHNFPINEVPSIMRLKKGKKDDRKDEKV